MVTKPNADELPTNRLLALLTPRDYASLRPHLERLPLEYRKSLDQAGQEGLDSPTSSSRAWRSLCNTPQRTARLRRLEPSAMKAWSVCRSRSGTIGC